MIARLILVLSVIAIALATLTPGTPSASLPFLCFRCGTRPGVDVLLNILLFLPCGAALRLVGVRWRWALLIVVATTTSIELLQFTIIPGRYASLRDIVSNTVGGIIGWQLALHWRLYVLPTPRIARRLAAGTAGLWLVSQAFTAYALAVVLPPAPWWAQITLHDLGFPEVFKGKVLGVSVDRTNVPYSDRLDESDVVRNAIRRGGPLRATVTGVTASRGTAPIVVLAANDNLSEVVSLLQKGTDAAFRIRTRSSTMGLRSPALRLSGAFSAGSERDTVVLEGRYSNGHYTLRAESSRTTLERTVAPSPSWIWMLLMPVPHYAFGAEVRWVTGLWMLLSLGLIGFWTASARRAAALHERNFAVGMSLIAAPAMGLGIVPLVFGIPLSHWSEWIAAVAGAAVGWALGRLVAIAS